MNALNAITIAGKEIPGWTLETALFWLLFAIVVITIFMVIVFAVLLHRVGKNKPVAQEAPETVEYGITVTAPEGLPALQVALYNGGNQIGLAVPVIEGRATLHAVPGDYTIKLFGLPENYKTEAPAVSATEHYSEVVITKKSVEEKSQPPVVVYTTSVAPASEKAEEPVVAPASEKAEEPVVAPEPEKAEEPVVAPAPEKAEEPVVAPAPEKAEEPVVAPAPEKAEETIVAPAVAEIETLDYVITVIAPNELSELQVALYNGNVKIGTAVNVIDGTATIAAPAGDYSIKVFGLPDDDYIVNAELLSAEKREVTVTIDYCEDYYIDADENAPKEADEGMLTYKISLIAPEELQSLQVALFNGNEQIGEAVNVEDHKAIITAPAGDYYVKVFCLPDDDYVASVELLSATVREATVIIEYCEDYHDINDGEEEVVEEEEEESQTEEVVPTVSEIIEVEPEEPKLVEYHVAVTAPSGLHALQVALYNGDTQVGNAANIESGTATLTAEEGDYTLKLFGLPEGYEVNAGTVSTTRHFATVTITEAVKEELATAEDVEETENDPLIIEEESFDGGILRYDRSFKARYIQSDNEVKGWYTELKNELLSYKKVKDRLSWKRESYNCGRNPVAILSFRGNTLCLYLPLDPAEYAESKYKVESVEDNASYADTPCLYRIKNDRRAKYAKELIAMVTEKLGAVRVERDSVDYYEPYEGIVQLINKGLIKRNIKDKASEAIFVAKKTETDFKRAEEILEAATTEDDDNK